MAKYLKQFNIELGKRLKERRKEVGFTSQEKFAEAVGVSRGSVALWESGDNGIDDSNYPAIMEALNVTEDFFKSIHKPSETIEELSKIIAEQQKTIDALQGDENTSIDALIMKLSPELYRRVQMGLLMNMPEFVWHLYKIAGLEEPFEMPLAKMIRESKEEIAISHKRKKKKLKKT